MTGQLLVMVVCGVVLGACGGYPGGRILRARERDAVYEDGFEAGHEDVCPECLIGDVPRTSVDGYLVSDGLDAVATSPGHSGGLPSLAGGPPHDWREQTAAELAPEALANESWEDSLTRPRAVEGAPGQQGRSGGQGPASTDAGALAAAPSPYGEVLTPAQRRRDKHKQRGQYAPAPGWTPDESNILSPHWKPEGDRWMAEWRIEWQDDVAAVDEEIAEWTARQRAWLAADRWDRGARRLGAVA